MDVDEISAGSASEGSIALRPFSSKRFHPSVFELLVGLEIKHANHQTGMIVGGNINENGAFFNVRIDGVPDSEPLQVKTTMLRDLLFPNYPNDMIIVKLRSLESNVVHCNMATPVRLPPQRRTRHH